MAPAAVSPPASRSPPTSSAVLTAARRDRTTAGWTGLGNWGIWLGPVLGLCRNVGRVVGVHRHAPVSVIAGQHGRGDLLPIPRRAGELAGGDVLGVGVDGFHGRGLSSQRPVHPVDGPWMQLPLRSTQQPGLTSAAVRVAAGSTGMVAVIAPLASAQLRW